MLPRVKISQGLGWIRSVGFAATRSAAIIVLNSLSACASSDFRALNYLAIAVVTLPPWSEALSERLYDRLIASTRSEILLRELQSKSAPRSGLSGRVAAFLRRLSKNSELYLSADSWQIYRLSDVLATRDAGDIDQVLTKTFDYTFDGDEEIHVFVETAEPLAAIAHNEKLAGRRFVIHAFDDRSAELKLLGISDRAQLASLRDKFPDISPEAEAMQRYSRSLAERCADLLCSALLDNDRNTFSTVKGATVVALEDDFAWQLALAESIRWAARALPDTAKVIYLTGAKSNSFGIASLLLSAVDPDRLYLCCARNNRIRSFRRALRKLVGVDDRATSPRSVGEAKAKWQGLFARQSRRAMEIGSAAAARVSMSARVDTSPPVIVTYNPSVPAYAETAAATVQELLSRDSPVIAIASASNVAFNEAGFQPARRSRICSLSDTSFLWPLLQSAPPAELQASIMAWLKSELSAMRSYDGIDVFDVIEASLLDAFSRKLFMALAASSFIDALAARFSSRVLVATPTRYWLIRAMADRARQSGRMAVVDIQSLNVIRHEKYIPPAADYAGVIDRTAATIYEDYFKFPADRIRLVGSPHNDAQRRAILGHDRGLIAERLGLNRNCRVRILLASQLQPIERMSAIVDTLAEFLEREPRAEVILKLHPREGEGRIQAFKDCLAKRNVEGRFVVARQTSPSEAIAASDICVTIYSNMAREAAIAGKEVIVTRLDGWIPPIRFDEEGLARGAQSREELLSVLAEAVARIIERPEGSGNNSRYFEANPHFAKANAQALIADLAMEAAAEKCRTQSAANRSPPHALKKITVLAEAGQDLLLLSADAFQNASVTAFCPTAPKIAGGELPHLRIMTPMSGSLAKCEFDAAVRTADQVATKVTTAIVTLLSRTDVGPMLAVHHDAVWLTVRPRLIDALTNSLNWHEGLKQEADEIHVLGHSDLFIECIAASAKKVCPNVAITRAGAKTGPEKGSVNGIAERMKRGLSTVMLAPTGTRMRVLKSLTASALAKLGAPSTSPSKSPNTTTSSVQYKEAGVPPDVVSQIATWLSGVKAAPVSIPSGPLIVLTTGWHLKTVPPTIIPIFEALPRGNVLALTLSTSGHKAMANALDATTVGRDGIYLCPDHIMAMAPTLAPQAIKSLRKVAVQAIEMECAGVSDDPILKAAIAQSADVAVRRDIWQTLAWAEICARAFGSRNSVSIACPGRQWHSEVAHRVAKQAGALSITVQNAYMTGGYTYTKPTGDIVTAIDTWSRDVFIRDYDVDPASILVCSTPRFDYLAKMKAGSQSQARAELGLGSGQIVVFAAQPDFDAVTEVVIKAFAAFDNVEPLNFVIKLHPRSTESVVTQMKSIASAISTKHSIRVTKDEPIQLLISAADVASTVFSNVGIEAAALEKPLLITHLLKEPLPLPIDEFDIGYVAKCEADIHEGLRKLLHDPDYRADVSLRQKAFLDNNPAIRDGASSKIIADLINRGLGEASLESSPRNGSEKPDGGETLPA